MIKDKLKLRRLARISSKLGDPKNYRKCIQDLVKFFPFAYHNILRRPEFTPLAKWIVDSTGFLDYDCGMNTRVKYAVDGKKEIYRCHCCNKPIRTTMKPLLKTKIFWCSPACQGQDPYLKAKLSSSHKKIALGRPHPPQGDCPPRRLHPLGKQTRRCKPDSVPSEDGGNHLSVRPEPGVDNAASNGSPPIWSCCGRSLPCDAALTVTRRALTPPFHPYLRSPGGGLLSVALVLPRNIVRDAPLFKGAPCSVQSGLSSAEG